MEKVEKVETETVTQEETKETDTIPTIDFIKKINSNEHLLKKDNFKELLVSYKNHLDDCQFIEKIIPRMFKNNDDLFKMLNVKTEKKGSYDFKTLNNVSPYNLHNLLKALLKPIWDLLDRGGKCWRSVFCLFLAEAFGCKEYVSLFDLGNVLGNDKKPGCAM